MDEIVEVQQAAHQQVEDSLRAELASAHSEIEQLRRGADRDESEKMDKMKSRIKELNAEAAQMRLDFIRVSEENQVLVQVTRRGDRFDHKELEPVRFVPLLGGVVR